MKTEETPEEKAKKLEEEVKSRTVIVPIKEKYSKKIIAITQEKQRLQEQFNVVKALFDKENAREGDLIDLILDQQGIESTEVENMKMADDNKSITIIKKKVEEKKEEKKLVKEVVGNNNVVGDNNLVVSK